VKQSIRIRITARQVECQFAHNVSMVIALPANRAFGHLSRSKVNDCVGAAKVKRSRCTQLPGDVKSGIQCRVVVNGKVSETVR